MVMKKTLYTGLSILTLSTIFGISSYQVAASEIGTTNQDTSNLVRGPLTGPDGENLYPGGVPDHTMINIVNDSFSNWNSSIFSQRQGNPVISNNVLRLPRLSSVRSTNINLTHNMTYRVTIGGLKGSVTVVIRDVITGHAAERTITSNGTDVSFNYHYRGSSITPNGPVYVDLVGNIDSEMNRFRVDKY